MFTVIAWNSDRAAAQATLLELAGVADDHVRVEGNNIICPRLALLFAAYAAHGTAAAAGSVTQARIASPELRKTILKDLANAHDTNTLLTLTRVNLLEDSPLPLVPDEAITFLMANGALAAARGLGVAFLADAPRAPVTAPIFTVRATSVIAAVANAWTSGTLTLDQTLPKGRYQLVGARCISAAQCGAYRFILTEYPNRPGGLITTGLMTPDLFRWRHGHLGVWGEFEFNQPPVPEIVGIAAVANPTFYLDLVKVG